MTLSAESVQLHLMRHEPEPVLLRHRFLQFFDRPVFKFLDGAAGGADKMVVMMLGTLLEEGLPFSKMPLKGKTCIDQHHQGSVDGGVADGWILRTGLFEELLDFVVLVWGGKKDLEDNIALVCFFQSLFGKRFIDRIQFGHLNALP